MTHDFVPFPGNVLVYTPRMCAESGAGVLHKTKIHSVFYFCFIPGGIAMIYASLILSVNSICILAYKVAH